MIATHPAGPLGEAAWIDLLDPTPEEVQRVRDATGLRVPTKHEVSEIESSSRLGFQNGAFYVSAPLIAHVDEGEVELAPVGFVLSSRVLLTLRFQDVGALGDARVTCEKRGETTAEDAFLRILEAVVDRAADALEHAGAECDGLSRSAFRERKSRSGGLRAALQRVGRLANKTSQLRDELLGVARVAAFVTGSGLPDAPAANAGRMKAIRTDIASLAEYELRLSSNLQFVLDATLGFINIEQNDVVKILTVASVAGIPPVLIAGIYGMNFRQMPELSWPEGYPLAIALIVVSTVVPVLWFKKRGWL
jgi:magnesium transporter